MKEKRRLTGLLMMLTLAVCATIAATPVHAALNKIPTEIMFRPVGSAEHTVEYEENGPGDNFYRMEGQPAQGAQPQTISYMFSYDEEIMMGKEDFRDDVFTCTFLLENKDPDFADFGAMIGFRLGMAVDPFWAATVGTFLIFMPPTSAQEGSVYLTVNDFQISNFRQEGNNSHRLLKNFYDGNPHTLEISIMDDEENFGGIIDVIFDKGTEQEVCMEHVSHDLDYKDTFNRAGGFQFLANVGTVLTIEDFKIVNTKEAPVPELPEDEPGHEDDGEKPSDAKTGSCGSSASASLLFSSLTIAFCVRKWI